MYFLKLLSTYLIVISTLFIIGSCINYIVLRKVYPLKENIFLNVFLNVLVPYLFISSLTAIVFTSGVSYNWVVLAPLILWYISLKQENKQYTTTRSSFPNQKLYVAVLTLTLLFSFSFIYFSIGAPSKTLNIEVDYDYYLYAKLAAVLIKTGVENHSAILSNIAPVTSPVLYHYTDLWFTGISASLLKSNTVEALLFINYPVLIFLTIIGSVGILNKTVPLSPILLLILVIVILYGISTHLPFDDNAIYKQAFNKFNASLATKVLNTKTLIIIPPMIMAFYYLQKNNLYVFVLFLVIIMGSYNTTIPGIAGGTALLFLYEIIKTRILKKEKKVLSNYKNAIALFIAFILFTVLFLKLYVKSSNIPFEFIHLELKSIIILFIEYIISPWLIYWLVFITFVGIIIKNKASNFLIQVAVFIMGLQLFATFFVIFNHQEVNINQALSNLIYPIIISLFIFIFTNLYIHKKATLIIIFLLTINTFNNYINRKSFDSNTPLPVSNSLYPTEFKQKIETYLLQDSTKRGDWLVLVGGYTQQKWSFTRPGIGQFILNIESMNYPFDISPYFKKDVNHWCNLKENKTSPLCYNITHTDTSKHIISFIKTHNIPYIYCENRNLIPENLKSSLSLVAYDSITENVFYKINIRTL